jgi:hypothetical protein
MRFLGAGINEMSDVIEVQDAPNHAIVGNIRLPRIAACFIDNPNPGYQGYGYRFVEVSIAYQVRDDENDKWDIHVVRTGFSPNIHSASDWESVDRWRDDRRIVQASWVPFEGMMMPDIAYDPRNDNLPNHSRGDLYLVYTFYNPDAGLPEGKGPRVYVTFGIRYDTNSNPDDWHFTEFGWFGRTLIQRLYSTGVPGHICHGFHPKIDIGYVNFTPGDGVPEWTVAVAFTADTGFFEPHIAFWNAGWPIYPPIIELPVRLPPYNDPLEGIGYVGFMPSIDIGPRGANHCAVTWTQTRSESWNDVTVGYVDNHGTGFYLYPHDEEGIMEAFAFPSVAVWDEEDVPANHFRTSISYLNSLNPVTNRWDSLATTYDTIYTPPSITVTTVGQETVISDVVHGLYDSGSQYSNWYGISSSMIVNNGYYWVLYSAMPDPEDEVPDLNLNRVYGAYGFTD